MYVSRGTLQNRLGFTLIELLAVIVILAIIALIATPIVLNIISESKESATLQSAEFYLGSVENAVAQKIMDEPTFRPEICDIQSDGNLDCEGTKVEVEIKGEKPTSGQITLQTGKITGVTLVLSEKIIIKNTEGKLVYQTIPTPKSFAEDDWSTIVANVQMGNTDAYNVGDTKEIELTGFTNTERGSNGLYTVRIANKTNSGDVCTNDSFKKEDGTIETYSKTACGFVIEFEDIILHSGDDAKMNLTATNVGGWSASKMRTYVNDVIYNALPKDLREIIINTTVVSGHGATSGEKNSISTDKLYLLSSGEVWAQGASNDTARQNTRQLDYYKDYKNTDESIGVTTSNYSGAIKKFNGNAGYWWLRSTYSNFTHNFYYVYVNGGCLGIHANTDYGVAPAFRIG